MVTLADNKEINSVEDLRDKVIGAQSISDFSGAQVQFYVMIQNGLDYIMDPKQVIFTGKWHRICRNANSQAPSTHQIRHGNNGI